MMVAGAVAEAAVRPATGSSHALTEFSVALPRSAPKEGPMAGCLVTTRSTVRPVRNVTPASPAILTSPAEKRPDGEAALAPCRQNEGIGAAGVASFIARPGSA